MLLSTKSFLRETQSYSHMNKISLQQTARSGDIILQARKGGDGFGLQAACMNRNAGQGFFRQSHHRPERLLYSSPSHTADGKL
jgi:hypothetical protein